MVTGRQEVEISPMASPSTSLLREDAERGIKLEKRTGSFSRKNSFGGMFRLKQSDSHLTLSQLPKCLTFWQLIPLGVGSTIGAGVYVLIGTIAREKAGPALPISFLIAGIAAALAALCYAELASRCPSAGSAYHYAYTTVGESVAWLIGWALILEYSVGGASVARGISPNLSVIVGGDQNLPFILSRLTIPGTEVVLDPCAAIMVALITVLLSAGIKESAMFQLCMTWANVLVLTSVVILGTYLGCKSGWPGYEHAKSFTPFGINGVLGGAGVAFFAYIGFDTVASAAEEVKKPQRDLPLGIGLSLLACATLYILVSIVIVGIVPYYSLDPDTPMSQAFAQFNMPWATYFISMGALAALCTTLLGSLLPQSRILMVMGRDGLLPPWFSQLTASSSSSSSAGAVSSHGDKGGGVPLNSTVITGIFSATMAFFMEIGELSGMVSAGTLLAFTVVSISILILRYVPPVPPRSPSRPSQTSIASAKSDALYIPPPAPHSSSQSLWAHSNGRPPRPPNSSSLGNSSLVFNRIGSLDSCGTSPVVAILSDDQLNSALFRKSEQQEGQQKRLRALARAESKSNLSPRGGIAEDSFREDEAFEGKMDGVDSLRGGDVYERRREEEEEESSGSDEDYGKRNGEEERQVRDAFLDGMRVVNENKPKSSFQETGSTRGLFVAPSNAGSDAAGSQGWRSTASSVAQVIDLDESEEGQASPNRTIASWAIAAVVVGAPLLSFSATASSFLPRWAWMSLCALGLVAFGGGTLALFLLPEDEGRHAFGTPGGFVCPFVPVLPVSSILVNVYLMVNLGHGTWVRCTSWLFLGALVYLFYGIHHSVLATVDGPRIIDASKRTKSWWTIPTATSEWLSSSIEKERRGLR